MIAIGLCTLKYTLIIIESLYSMVVMIILTMLQVFHFH